MSGRINIIGSWFEKIANGFIFGTQSNKFTFKGNVEIEGDGNFEHTFQNKNGIVAHLEDFENGIDFTPIATPTHERGRIYFDDVNDCISFMDNISGTSVQVGYEMLMRARNNTGSTITNGSVVYISGAIGQNPTIALAQSNTEPTSEIIGVATHNIANNTVGKVCVFGLVNDIDTSAFTDGDFLYLSSSVAGGLTATTPSSPNFVVSIGVVEHAHPTQGKILVKPQRALSNNNTLGTSQKVSVTENVVKTNLSTKLDKVSTVDVEKVYVKNADGTQGVKATSEFKDVIFGYFNGTNFYTDAGFTNLITPESGKIYVNIAVTPSNQYRWSGSAYVQVGGGNNSPIFCLSKATESSVITGTTSEVIAETIILDRSIFVNNKVFTIFNRVKKIGSAGGFSIRYRINTTNSLIGSRQVAIATLPNGAFFSQAMERSVNIRTDLLEYIASNTSYGYENASTSSANQTMNIAGATNLYLFITVSLNSISDSLVNSNYIVTLYK